MHLILAVMPEPERGLREAVRVVKPGGRIAVFDKFLPEGRSPGLLARLGLALLDLVFTSTNRRMGEILERAAAPLAVACDEPSVGSYRHLILRKV